jgi:hypothetical protein
MDAQAVAAAVKLAALKIGPRVRVRDFDDEGRYIPLKVSKPQKDYGDDYADDADEGGD